MTEMVEKIGVLYVDDEEKALKYFSRAFGGEFPVYTATSVKEAKSILEKEADDIAILVTDQRMPEEKGVELLKYVRKEYPRIIRILTTAYSDLDDAIEAVNNGEIFRYITKPWNIAALKLELRQTMQFYELRHERDQLMREKLGAKQRMEGVSRVRDLLMIASSLTLTRRPVEAVQAFIEQLPIQGKQEPNSRTCDTWGAMKSELLQMVAVSRDVISLIGDDTEFTSIDVGSLLKESCPQSLRFQGSENLPMLQGSSKLIDGLFQNLYAWLGTGIDAGTLAIGKSEDGECIRISIEAPNADWGGTSLLAIPAELLSSYFICYHHGGTLQLRKAEGAALSIVAKLPVSGRVEVESELTEDWLDSVLRRFENW